MAGMRQTRAREGIVKKSRKLLEAEEDGAVLGASKSRKRQRAARKSSEAETEAVQDASPRAEQAVAPEVGNNEGEVAPRSSGQIDATEKPQRGATLRATQRARGRRRGVKQATTEVEPPILQQKSNSPGGRAAKGEKRRSKRLRLRSQEPPVGLGISDATAISPTQVEVLVITQTSSSEPPKERIASPVASQTVPEIPEAQRPPLRKSQQRTRRIEVPLGTSINDKPVKQVTKPATKPLRKSKRSTRKAQRQHGCLQLSPNTVANDIYLMVQIGVSNQTSREWRRRRKSQEAATSPQPKTPDTGKLAKRLFESLRSPV